MKNSRRNRAKAERAHSYTKSGIERRLSKYEAKRRGIADEPKARVIAVNPLLGAPYGGKLVENRHQATAIDDLYSAIIEQGDDQ